MTIKVYDSEGGASYIEFGNNGQNNEEVMTLTLSHEESKFDLYFNLSKSDAKEVINYLKKEFNF